MSEKVTVKNAPNSIHLNYGESYDFSDGEVIDADNCEEVTWSEDAVMDVNVRYVREDRLNDLTAENERIRGLLADVLHEYFTADEIAYETCEAIKQHLTKPKQSEG